MSQRVNKDRTVRLSDEDVARLERNTFHLCTVGELASMTAELRERRAADLTEPQLDDVRAMLRVAVHGGGVGFGPERIDILRAVLVAHGVRP